MFTPIGEGLCIELKGHLRVCQIGEMGMARGVGGLIRGAWGLVRGARGS